MHKFISLQGHVTATYDELVQALGEPDYMISADDAEDKVTTEWCFKGYDWAGEEISITVYDWKNLDNGIDCRSGEPYRWHIGGTMKCAVDVVLGRLGRWDNSGE
jgi:uncharacterized protein YjhX (UPF0386 family)